VGRELASMDHPHTSFDPKLDREQGSIIITIATDAPFLPHQLARLAKRATNGLARTGSINDDLSGDIAIAFSTANRGQIIGVSSPSEEKLENATVSKVEMMPGSHIDPFFAAVTDATEEAVINALIAADTMTGYKGHRVEAIDHDKVQPRRYGGCRVAGLVRSFCRGATGLSVVGARPRRVGHPTHCWILDVNVKELIAIDVHTHAEVSCRQPADEVWQPYEAAASKYFKADKRPTITQTVAYYPERKIGLVMFTVDSEHEIGSKRIPNEEVCDAARENSDIMLAFADKSATSGEDLIARTVPESGDRAHPGFGSRL
jgi:hypothetical protein